MDKDRRESIKKKIRELNELGFTIQKIATFCGVTPTTVQRWKKTGGIQKYEQYEALINLPPKDRVPPIVPTVVEDIESAKGKVPVFLASFLTQVIQQINEHKLEMRNAMAEQKIILTEIKKSLEKFELEKHKSIKPFGPDEKSEENPPHKENNPNPPAQHGSCKIVKGDLEIYL